MLRRLAQVVLAGGVLGVGVLAVVCSVMGEPEAGSFADDSGRVVLRVEPGSPVWRDGIRSGDQILELPDALDPGGWRIETSDGTVHRQSFADSHLARLRRYIPWSVLALAAAAIAALLAYRGRPAAAAVLPLAIGAVALPLFYAGNSMAGLVAGVAIFGGNACHPGLRQMAALDDPCRGSGDGSRAVLDPREHRISAGF